MKNQTKPKPAKNSRSKSAVLCAARPKLRRKTARIHGTPIYVRKDGKVVAEKAVIALR
jgi:hypothetical protein